MDVRSLRLGSESCQVQLRFLDTESGDVLTSQLPEELHIKACW